jgi:hypothetical protein
MSPSFGGCNHPRNLVQQRKARLLELFGSGVRCGINTGFNSVNLSVYVAILVGTVLEMRIIHLQRMQDHSIFGKLGMQVMRGMGHRKAYPFSKKHLNYPPTDRQALILIKDLAAFSPMIDEPDDSKRRRHDKVSFAACD